MKYVLAAVVLISGTIWSSARAADSIVGTWRLISLSEQETESKAVHNPLGNNPSGLLTYTDDGRMMVIFTASTRHPAAGPKVTESEAAELYKTMAAYAGTYGFDGEKVTHKIEISWNQAFNGSNLQRYVTVSGDSLTLRSAPFVSPFLGKEIVGTTVFERVR
jgi:hypothetical protein